MTGLLIWAAIGLSLLLFGLWMGFSAKTGAQSTAGSAFVLAATVLLLIVFWMAVPAHAHDHARPELDGWFKSLHARSGAWCCDEKDAMTAEDWDMQGGHYRARIEGSWIVVPDDAIVDGPNRAQVAKVWFFHKDGEPAIRCFLPGSMT